MSYNNPHRNLRRRRTTVLRTQLCVSLLLLLLAYVGHIVIDYTDTLPQDIGIPCTVVSVFTHYFTLTSLVWLGSEALLMVRKLAFGQRLGKPANLYFAIISITSWGEFCLFCALEDETLFNTHLPLSLICSGAITICYHTCCFEPGLDGYR